MGLVDATGLRLVHAPVPPGLISAYDRAIRQPLTQWQLVMRKEDPLFPRLTFEEYLLNYRPAYRDAYRDWPPARARWQW